MKKLLTFLVLGFLITGCNLNHRHERVAELVDQLEERGGWEVYFLVSDQSGVEEKDAPPLSERSTKLILDYQPKKVDHELLKNFLEDLQTTRSGSSIYLDNDEYKLFFKDLGMFALYPIDRLNKCPLVCIVHKGDKAEFPTEPTGILLKAQCKVVTGN